MDVQFDYRVTQSLVYTSQLAPVTAGFLLPVLSCTGVIALHSLLLPQQSLWWQSLIPEDFTVHASLSLFPPFSIQEHSEIKSSCI